ncbi:MAG: hypothetical protein RMK73_06660 [Geminicoccaceae bacterium]|nr:hypothetical protein [Geminicoccaceae bacterium]
MRLLLLLVSLVSTPQAVHGALASAREPCALPSRPEIVLAQTNCGPCQTSGPNKGKKRCCELVGGDWICRWVQC